WKRAPHTRTPRVRACHNASLTAWLSELNVRTGKPSYTQSEPYEHSPVRRNRQLPPQLGGHPCGARSHRAKDPPHTRSEVHVFKRHDWSAALPQMRKPAENWLIQNSRCVERDSFTNRTRGGARDCHAIERQSRCCCGLCGRM